MIFVVLGMHKSGTTLVSQILHHSGIDMGEFDEQVSYDAGNKYERRTVLEVDMEVLGAQDDTVIDLRSHRRVPHVDQLRKKMQEIIRVCDARHEDWGFKDPRSVLVHDLWHEVLPEYRIVAVYREAPEVWPRFKWGRRYFYRNVQRAYDYLSIWQDHNRNLIRILENTDREHILLSYKDLMSDDRAFRMLERFVGRPLEDRRKPGLYRSRQVRSPLLNLVDSWMHMNTGVCIEKTMARLDELKTPLD